MPPFDEFTRPPLNSNTKHVLDFISLDIQLEKTLDLISELDNKMSVLPRVNPDGSSDCPFAGELFYAKERAAQELADHLKVLQHTEAMITGELDRCQQNWEILAGDAGVLQTEAARRQYDNAETIQAHQWRQVQEYLQKFRNAILEAQRWLAKAEEKKYPGELTPPAPPSPPMDITISAPNSLPGEPPPFSSSSFQAELEDLISFGPMSEDPEDS
ncbi:MAG: hypothetical protein JXR73_16195 [Candidatus Omnitrophica bacterium]|nr:hypothetical protein [Candidatus Omnitrophota bacterium]